MSKTLNVWLISGETSGDMYGAEIAAALRRLAGTDGCGINISGMGGIRMREAGVELLADSTELGVVGVAEVVKHLFTFFAIFRRLVRRAEADRPDAVVMIDYPGFNLELAKAMWKRGIPVIWFVSPQVWTWKKYRIFKLEKYCRKMLVIFPFEVEVYGVTRLDTEFVGHPLLEMVDARRDPSIVRDRNLVLLLPGSRDMEVSRLLIPMLDSAAELVKRHSELRFVLTAPRPKIYEKCRAICARYREKHPESPEIDVLLGGTAEFQQRAVAGIAASGTVTVESAIAGLPLVVVYKMNLFTILLAAVLVKLYRGFFTMVNVILNREAFEEFIQYEVKSANIVPALERILPGGSRREQVEKDMAELRGELSPDGKTNALECCAEKIYRTIQAEGKTE
ncbi:MAG: lipid-A-disaccharide synthase [Victivallaceae bacterium]|nr:lipid-A-disaccharide synthase [Victivallaceae bacterium]